MLRWVGMGAEMVFVGRNLEILWRLIWIGRSVRMSGMMGCGLASFIVM